MKNTYDFTVPVLSPEGLHLSPAAQIIEILSNYNGRVNVSHPERGEYDARDIFGLISTRALPGSRLTFSFEQSSSFEDAQYLASRIEIILSGK